jgi:hypothetical protein
MTSGSSWPNSGREAAASALPTFNQQNSNKPDCRANCCAGRNEEGWDEHCERAHDETQFDDKQTQWLVLTH